MLDSRLLSPSRVQCLTRRADRPTLAVPVLQIVCSCGGNIVCCGRRHTPGCPVREQGSAVAVAVSPEQYMMAVASGVTVSGSSRQGHSDTGLGQSAFPHDTDVF